ncbi:hypothetical protein ACVIU7_003187 [Bradyrhizobium liaoningense]
MKAHKKSSVLRAALQAHHDRMTIKPVAHVTSAALNSDRDISRYLRSRKAAQRALIVLTQLGEVRNGPFQEQCRKFGGDAKIQNCVFRSLFL